MFRHLTLTACLTLGVFIAQADQVVLFDAESLSCDGNRLYIGDSWDNKTTYNLPQDNATLSSKETDFINGNKELHIYNDAFKSGAADGKFTFTFGWSSSDAPGQFQLALGNVDKPNNIVDYTDITTNQVLEVSLSDFTGDKWNQTTSMTAQEAADKLKEAGYISIHGHHYDLKKVVYEYTPGGEPIPDDTFSGVETIQGLTFQFGPSWTGFPDNKDNKPENFNVLWIKPAYMPDLQAGDAVRITFNEANGEAQYIWRGDNEWVKAGSKEADAGGYWNLGNAGITGPYTFTVTSANLASIKENGLWVDANGGPKIEKVEFVYNKHSEAPGEIIAGGDNPNPPTPPVVNDNYTSQVIWQTGDAVTSVLGADTKIEFQNEWMSRYGKEAGEPDALGQAFHIPAENFMKDENLQINLDDRIVVYYEGYGADSHSGFYFKDTSENPEGVWLKRGERDGMDCMTSGAHEAGCGMTVHQDWFVIEKDSYERYLNNYRIVAALRQNGLYIDGKNAKVTKVEVRHYNNGGLDDTHPYFTGKIKADLNEGDNPEHLRGYVVDDTEGNRSFDWDTNKRIRPVAFTNYMNGERIHLQFRITGDNPQVQLKFIRPNSIEYKISESANGCLDLATGKLTYRPTWREIRAMKANGLFLVGQDLELEEVTFGYGATADDQTEDLWIHNDWMTLGHDNGKVYEGDIFYSDQVKIYISNVHFKRAAENSWLGGETGSYEGYSMTFAFPWVGDNAYIRLSYDPSNVYEANRDPLNWYYEAAFGPDEAAQAPFRAPSDEASEEAGYYDNGEKIDLAASAGVSYHDHQLTSDDVNKLIKYGVWIQGGNADFQSAVLRSPLSVSGTQTIEENLMDVAIDFNKPYQAWSIDGRRVADISAPGLYIVRQDAKVQKVLIR